MHHEPRTIDRFLIIGAAVLFSTGGAAIKLCGLTAWQVASFRSGIAALALVVLLPTARRSWTWRTWTVGLAYAATMVFYVVANKLTTAANTIFLQGTAPLYILILGPFLLRERIRRRDIIVMFALVIGLALLFVGDHGAESTAPRPAAGNLIAAAAGITWALTLMGLRWLGRHGQEDGAPAAVAVGNLIACLAVLPLALPITGASAADWGAVVFLGVIQIALAYVLLTRGMRRVGALEASLLLLAEPVLNPAWAFLVHHEVPTLWASLGGAVVLGATGIKSVVEARRRQP